MAKELPYFKFEPNQWENGNIQILSREDKGLFIDLCSVYWSRLGDVPFKLAVNKLCGGNATALNSLCDENIIEVIDDNIYIKFLSEQLQEFDNVSAQNSKNAKEGWEKRRKQKALSERNATVLIPQSESDAIRGDKIKEDNIYLYIEKDFLKDWNENRTEVLKTPSHCNRLTFEASNEFRQLSKAYTREQFKQALRGLFKQKDISGSMKTNPTHFLKYFDSYLQAYHDKNEKIYDFKNN